MTNDFKDTAKSKYRAISANSFMAIVTVLDVFFAFTAGVIAFWGSRGDLVIDTIVVGVTLVVSFAVHRLLQIKKLVWRHFDIQDIMSLFYGAVISGSLLFTIIFIILGNVEGLFQRAIIFVSVWFALMTLARMMSVSRSSGNPLHIFKAPKSNLPKLLLIGDVNKCAEVIDRESIYKQFEISGLITFSERMVGRSIKRISVLQTAQHLDLTLDNFFARYNEYPVVGLLRDVKTPKLMRDIIKVTAPRNVKLFVLGDKDTSQEIRDVDPVDLFRRPIRELDKAPLTSFVKGRRILVTGGGGSIGHGLALEIARHNPSEIAIIDSCEYNLYSVRGTLKALGYGNAPTILGDIRNLQRLRSIWQAFKPDVVLHAAAFKHVHIVEENVCEGVRTNVFGTQNVLQVCHEFGVKDFVLISSDKAANPESVMGATKRIAEIIALQQAEKAALNVSVVRFGNVAGTSGSVIPLFQEQINSGGPITVTDKRMTRFFLTLEEACALVLQAAAMPERQDAPSLYLLDMGKPISIVTLAENMIRLAGKIPDQDIMIEEIGIRAGEKLHEELYGQDEVILPADVKGVMRIASDTHHWPNLDECLRKLKTLANASEEDKCRDELNSVLRSLRTSSAPLTKNYEKT